jgi:hypothetical protein
MDIVIDLSFITDFLSLPPDEMFKRLFLYFGWIPIAIVFLWGSLQVWLSHIRGKWAEKNAKYTLLAIDVPRGMKNMIFGEVSLSKLNLMLCR